MTGDISVLPDKLSRVSGKSFTWTSRKTTANILNIINAPAIDNIDKMLQDQANCVDAKVSFQKIISATGTRTSASDSAVQTLQGKGYTISINTPT